MEKDNILKYLKDWNFWGSKFDLGVKRHSYLSKITKSIRTKEVIILTGIRRCGKSTLLLQLLDSISTKPKNTLIVNLEDPRVVNLSVDDLMKIYEVYLESLNPDKEQFIVLDEVQNVQNWERFARYLSENKKVNVFITGSNSSFLSSEFSSSLSGRYLEFRVAPLSFVEFLEFNGVESNNKLKMIGNEVKIKRLFGEYLKYGGFPKVVLTKEHSEKRNLLTSYYDTILIKDIAFRYKIKETTKLQELSRFYLTNISKIISMNKIKDVLGISLETVQRYSEYLENSFLIHTVPKFDYSLKKQIANPRKIYCLDLGIRNNTAFKVSHDVGRLLENIVYLALKMNCKGVFYYRTKNGLEVDFALKQGNKIKQMIQVTHSLANFTTQEREINSLIAGLKETNLKEGLILTNESEDTMFVKGFKITVMPIWKWLLSTT